MRPINYTQKGNKVTFHYKISDLREFIKRGRSKGDVGVLILEYNNGMKIYKGFGTIENPSKVIITWTLYHHDGYDGGKFIPDKIVNPSKYAGLFSKENYRFVTLNLGKKN